MTLHHSTATHSWIGDLEVVCHVVIKLVQLLGKVGRLDGEMKEINSVARAAEIETNICQLFFDLLNTLWTSLLLLHEVKIMHCNSKVF